MTGNLNPLFLKQSYTDNWDSFSAGLVKKHTVKWDYVILTASNEEQADFFRIQLEQRLENGFLYRDCVYAVLADPDGKRVGSGGATLNVIKYIAELEKNAECFEKKRILVIHSGGDSKRVPQYSALGKLFSPVPRTLPDSRRSTLFDEFIIGMSGVPGRITSGMLVLSGDVLLLFNPLMIDFSGEDAACISFKADVSIGRNHGVFLNGGDGFVKEFLHKQSVDALKQKGAVNAHGKVDIDTGAVLLGGKVLNSLYSLISDGTDGSFEKYVNDKVRLSFYGDFLYPLAERSSLEAYLKEAPEGEFSDELTERRKEIWEKLKNFRMKILALSPAEFIHFGTTAELLKLVTDKVSAYSYLDWSKTVNSNKNSSDYALSNSYVEDNARIGENAYIEDSYIYSGTVIGKNSIVSYLSLSGQAVPENTVMHCIKLKDKRFVVRIYGLCDNPKLPIEKGADFLGVPLVDFVNRNGFSAEDLWDGESHTLWEAKLFKPCKTRDEAIDFALYTYSLAKGKEDKTKFLKSERISLFTSFNEADAKEILRWQRAVSVRVEADRFLRRIRDGAVLSDMAEEYKNTPLCERTIGLIEKIAESSDFSLKTRIYYYLSKITDRKYGECFESRCFDEIRSVVGENNVYEKLSDGSVISKENVLVQLPVRVNFGGGWSDTPPYCIENGGTVLNAAIKLNGIMPIEVRIIKTGRNTIVLESADISNTCEYTDLRQLLDCSNPFDPHALHKAALIACGVVSEKDNSIKEISERIGGGFHLSTRVINIPRGSGLGTSSILAAACAKAIYEFFGKKITDDDIFASVLSIEQIMSTGGGWQDQVGGYVSGIKLITSEKGASQRLKYRILQIDEKTDRELNERFALIYTGQRRLARNLLRDIIGGYLGGRKETLFVLTEIQRKAEEMASALESGDVDLFAELMNQHWELSKTLDKGCTNTCIDHIFLTVNSLISGKMICGAGGGGFLQVVLKKGVTAEDVRERLKLVYQDSGIDVWECEFSGADEFAVRE